MAQCLTGPTEAGRVAPCKAGARAVPLPPSGAARRCANMCAPLLLPAACVPPPPACCSSRWPSCAAPSRASMAGPLLGRGVSSGGLRVGLRFLCSGPRRPAVRACLPLDGGFVRVPASFPSGLPRRCSGLACGFRVPPLLPALCRAGRRLTPLRCGGKAHPVAALASIFDYRCGPRHPSKGFPLRRGENEAATKNQKKRAICLTNSALCDIMRMYHHPTISRKKVVN